MAIRGPDRKPIIYRFNYEKSPPEFQIFVDYHECAHHQTGHVDQPHPPRNSYEHLMNERGGYKAYKLAQATKEDHKAQTYLKESLVNIIRGLQ